MSRYAAPLTLLAFLPFAAPAPAQTAVPAEPVEIGPTPQLLLDNYIVDNTWAGYADKALLRMRASAANPQARNPVLPPDAACGLPRPPCHTASERP